MTLANVIDRMAAAALIGVLLIPIFQSNLSGLTHTVTCRERMEAPFRVAIVDGAAVVTGAATLAAEQPTELCGGLTVDLRVMPRPDGGMSVTIPVVNRTDADWRGTVQLDVAGVRLPVEVGRVPAGASVTRTVTLRLPEGTTEFDGVLVVGP